MISPNTFRNESYKIKEMFDEIEIGLLEKMAKSLNRGTELPIDDWKIQKLVALGRYTGNRKEVIENARKISEELANTINSAFVKGAKESDIMASKLKELGSQQRPVTSIDNFYNINTNKLNVVLTYSHRDILNALTGLYGDVSIKYQEAIERALLGVISGSETLSDSVSKVTKQLADDGIGYVTYSNGSKMNTGSYMEMATRTASTRASLIASSLRNKEYGYELVRVSEYAGCSETCAPWQGRVYFDDTNGGVNNTEYPSLSTAIENGLFHPNCRHFKYPYDPEVQNEEPQVKPDPVLYEKEQQQRYNERQIKKWKSRDAVASNSKDKGYAKAKIKEWQKKNSTLVNSNDELRRDYSREQIG